MFGDRFSGNIRFIAGDSGVFSTGAQPERMRILGDNGFVGMGTTSPATNLDVRGANQPAITVGTAGGTDGALFLGNPAHGLRRNFNGVGNDVGLYTTAANLQFSANGFNNTQMTLNNAGTLDVGTRVQIAPVGNGTQDGSIVARRQDGSLALFNTGFNDGAGFAGYQIALVNNAGNAFTGGLYHQTGTNQATLVANIKNFVEPNPRDASTDIYYASMEGPEAGMYTRGTSTLINGQAVITLPSHFSDLASSQGLTVIVTPLSADSMGLAVVGKSVTGFQVRELMRGTGTYQFDWEIKAVRKQHLNYQVVRPWTDRRIANPDISDAQAWQIRERDVAETNARAAVLEAQASGSVQR
ncbi:MAG: hypothetical protein SFZ23_14645 [Planctomycetota bacterium]|nr:hypothetical protein [Planctomycetota bacterium]